MTDKVKFFESGSRNLNEKGAQQQRVDLIEMFAAHGLDLNPGEMGK